jgi:hypothetical protein
MGTLFQSCDDLPDCGGDISEMRRTLAGNDENLPSDSIFRYRNSPSDRKARSVSERHSCGLEQMGRCCPLQPRTIDRGGGRENRAPRALPDLDADLITM